MSDCVFCKRITNGEYVDRFANWVWFEPLNPVVKGHMLVVPVVHTANLNDGLLEADQTGWALRYFTNAIEGDYNLITSKGKNATQTVQHLHFHIVPRTENDGLKLPWTGQTAQPNQHKEQL
jgi:histidine triad (HIT) family protein